MKNSRTSWDMDYKCLQINADKNTFSIYNLGTIYIKPNVLSPGIALQVRPFCRPLLREHLFV